MAGKNFTAKQILFTFRDSQKQTSKILIQGQEMFSINNHLFAEVAAGNIKSVTFSEVGNKLTPQQAGQTELTAYNVEDVEYSDRQTRITAIANKELEVRETEVDIKAKRLKKELETI